MSNPHLQFPELAGGPIGWFGGSVGVLLIHGLTATVAEVRQLAERLHAEGYAICAPLLPGHGTSPEDANRVSWRDWIQHCEAALTEFSTRCERVFIGGESTGATIALHLAADHPEIAGVLAYAAAIKPSGSWLDLLKLRLFANRIKTVPKPDPGSNPLWQGYKVNPLRSVVQLYDMQKVVKGKLSAVHQPILVVHGRRDQTVHPDSPEIIMNSVGSQHKSLHWMEKSGHVVLLEDELPEICDLTLAFIRHNS